MDNEPACDTIIVVDDNPTCLTQIISILKDVFVVYAVPSVPKLFEMLENVIPDLILLDVEMPEIDGFTAIKMLKAKAHLANIPVIFLTVKDDDISEVEGFDLGASDYINKPVSAPRLLKRVSKELLLCRQRQELTKHADALESKIKKKTDEVLRLKHAILSTVADLVELRDRYTGGHIARTTFFVKTLIDELARVVKYREEILQWNMNSFLLSTQLHDVGKIAISDLILNKPGSLTPEEFEIVKCHVPVGVAAVKKMIDNAAEYTFLRHTLYITGTHHEKWDGSGYPLGLKGTEIPLEGRLMAIADVYDSLISERPYKKAFTHEAACNIIEDSSGMHFDPVLVNAFHRAADKFARVALKIGDPNYRESKNKKRRHTSCSDTVMLFLSKFGSF